MSCEIISGLVEHRPTRQKETFRMTWLEMKDYPEIQRLLILGPDYMWRCARLARRSEDYLKALVRGCGHVIGVWVGERLVGMTAVSLSRSGAADLAAKANIPPKERPRAVQVEFAMVHPDYVGNRLQQQMALQLKELAERRYGATYGCFAVASDNRYSLQTIFAFGSLISGVDMGRNKEIMLYAYRRLDNDKAPLVEGDIPVPCDDYQGHRRMIRSGLVGHAMRIVNGQLHIIYGRLISAN